VLPLLEAETVRSGWVSQDAFLAGYGAAHALPGPLFTFAAFLGTVQSPTPHGWLGGFIAAAGIFLPSFLLVFGVLPFWLRLRGNPAARAALAGINAAVVGLLLAALYDPVFVSSIKDGRDVALGLAAFALLELWKVPAWIALTSGTRTGPTGQSTPSHWLRHDRLKQLSWTMHKQSADKNPTGSLSHRPEDTARCSISQATSSPC
jgi:chromate transporter